MRYQMTAEHWGGREVFYVVDTEYPTNEQPVVIYSYLTCEVAQAKADALNEQDKQPAY